MFNQNAVAYTSDPNGVIGNFNGFTRMTVVLPPDGKSPLQMYTEALNSGKTVWVGAANDIKDEAGKILFKGGHAHMVMDADPKDPANTSILAYNPWGPSSANSDYLTPFKYDLAKLVGVAGITIFVDTPYQGG